MRPYGQQPGGGPERARPRRRRVPLRAALLRPPVRRIEENARLDGAHGPRSEHTEHLAALERELADAGLALPDGFAAFYGSEHLCGTFDEVSVTACWSDLSGPLHSPAEEGARLVRFLRDQQDCVIWYLCLRPSGEASVVFSHVELESAGWWAQGEPTEEVRAAVASSLTRCADTFEEFAYRFVVENELWMHANSADAESPPPPHLQAYADHYACADS